MAKKMVRGITDVKTITNQDFDTNNVNDLLSDGQYNYIHRKKGENEEYHNLTDNIKTLSSDNTDLLSVTNNNKTTNTATLHPKHDAQKEQLLESTDETIVISHGKNGTEETTSVDVNFEKVQEKLTAGDGLAIENNEIKIKPKNVETLPANSGFYNGAFIIGEWENPYSSISLNIDTNKLIQLAFRESVNTNGLIIGKYRFIVNNVPTSWKEMQLDSEYITSLLARKEQVLESTRNTVTINHGTNGTAEKTTVDTNPQKVLEHEKLKTGDGLTTSFNTDETTIMFKATKKTPETNLNTLGEGVIYGKGFSIDQVPGEVQDTSAGYVTINIDENKKVQFYIREQGNDYGVIRLYYRFISNGEVTEWRKMPGDRSDLNYELAQKEQVLESTRDTVTINHGANGTDEKTTVDTNPLKVLEHSNLLTDYGISKNTTGNTTKLGLEYTKVEDYYDLNNLLNGRIRTENFVNAPKENTWFFVSAYTEGEFTIQDAITLANNTNTTYRRLKTNNVWGEWREQVGDKSVIDGLLAQKQNKLTAMDGISITGDSIHLTTLNDYSEDLNNLTYTCTAKPIDNTPNLPTGVGGNGVLSVIRVGNVVSQTYHALDNNVYYRITNNSTTTFVWTPWVKVTTTAV